MAKFKRTIGRLPTIIKQQLSSKPEQTVQPTSLPAELYKLQFEKSWDTEFLNCCEQRKVSRLWQNAASTKGNEKKQDYTTSTRADSLAAVAPLTRGHTTGGNYN